MPRARFLGTGLAVPDRVVTNDDLSRVMDTSDEWIRTRTGIQERRWVREGETSAALAHTASLRAIEAAGLAPAELDAIIYATSTPDHFAPGNGVYLQRLLGVGAIPSIDIRNQCSGFVYALAIADAFIRVGSYRHVLVVGAEIQSTALDVSTRGRNTAVIFADGAGAAVLGPERRRARDPRVRPARRREPCRKAVGGRAGLDVSPAGVGPSSSRRAAISWRWTARRYSATRWRGCRSRSRPSSPLPGTATSDLALLVAHQANLRIAEMMQRSLGLRDEQVYNNIMWYGNTTAATIPIALDECVRAGRLRAGDLVALTAFGSGFLWGSALIRW